MLRSKLRKSSVIAATLAITLSWGASGFAFTKPPFPRIAGVNIGEPRNYADPDYQANLAKQTITIINYYPGMPIANGQTIDSVVRAIKDKNPNALVFVYVNSNELQYNSGAWKDYQSKLDSMKWWLYSDKDMNNKVPSTFADGYYIINNTPYTPKDSNGDNAIDWITKFYVNNYYKPNPSIDGFFMDNTFWKPLVDGDWKRSGNVVSQSDPNAGTWLRQGYARYYSLAKTLLPKGKYQIGNITEWGDPASILTEYQGLLDGGVMEGYIGKSWSVESWAGWQNMFGRYRKVMRSVGQPKLAIFNQWGDPGDYQGMRYGLASCLLNDAYYAFTSNAAGYSGVVWFDEYDANLGQASLPPSGAWQKGVWRRDFDNGIALVNPKGNGTQTVTLEGEFIKIKGKQDPTTNNGQTVTSVTLQDRDGIILLRKTPLKRPKAPQGVAIQP